MQTLKTTPRRRRQLMPMLSAGLVGACSLLLVLSPQADPLTEPAPASPTPVPGSSWETGPDPLKMPEGMPSLGNQHGDVAISSSGEIYVSVMQGLRSGVQVYAADGTYLRNLPDAPTDFHGFVIHRGDDGEFLYGPQLGAGKIVKLSLDGKVIMTIPGESIPKQYWQVNPKNQQAALRLTGCTVAPNGDIFVTDGYASDYVHRFNARGEYLSSFGGKAAPYHFKTLHKIAIDKRFDPPRLVGTDRANSRAVHLSLEGEMLGEIATDLLMPAAAVVQGDYLAVGEIKGRVTIFDKENKVVARLGENTNPAEVGTNKIEPSQWRPGIVNAPHGVAFSPRGDLYVSEYSVHGRVLKFSKGATAVVMNR